MCRDGKLPLVWSCEWIRLTEIRYKRVLLCCLAQNWTEEGELQCECPHITLPPEEEALSGEPGLEAS